MVVAGATVVSSQPQWLRPLNCWSSLLADERVSTQALVLLAGVGPLVRARAKGTDPAFISQAQVEAATGLDRRTVFKRGGVYEKASALGLLWLDNRGRSGGVIRKSSGGLVGEAGEWQLGNGQKCPTEALPVQYMYNDWDLDIRTHLLAVCGGELSAHEQREWIGLMDPANDLWRQLAYGHSWWRYFSLVGWRDHELQRDYLKTLCPGQPKKEARMINALIEKRLAVRKGSKRGVVLVMAGLLLEPAYLARGHALVNDKVVRERQKRESYLGRHYATAEGQRRAAATTYLDSLPDLIALARTVPGRARDLDDVLLRLMEGGLPAVLDFLPAQPKGGTAAGRLVEEVGRATLQDRAVATPGCVGGCSISIRCFH